MEQAGGDKTIAITGATSGIGRAAALALAAGHPRLVILARDPARGEETAGQLVRNGAAEAEVVECDLSLLASVREAAEGLHRRYERLDVLINDASIFRRRRELTPEGHECMMATNHLGPFLLTNLLLDLLTAAAPARIITVTAPSTIAPQPDDLESAERFSALRTFGRSKAAELLFTYALARRLQARGISVNACHPGMTRTGLMDKAPLPMRLLGVLLRITARTPEQAATGLVDLALSPRFDGITGQLVHDGKPIKAPFADDLELQERFWSASELATGLAGVA